MAISKTFKCVSTVGLNGVADINFGGATIKSVLSKKTGKKSPVIIFTVAPMQKDAQAFFVPMKAANSVAAKAAGVVSQCGTMIAVEIVPSVEVKIVNGKPVSKYVFASFLMPKMAQKDADRLFDEAKKANEAFASGMTPAELAEAEAMTVRPQVSNPME